MEVRRCGVVWERRPVYRLGEREEESLHCGRSWRRIDCREQKTGSDDEAAATTWSSNFPNCLVGLMLE